MNARSSFLTCALLAFPAAGLLGQPGHGGDVPTSRVHGIVLDESHIPIPDAQLRILHNADSGRVARTGTDGVFLFPAVPDGPSTLTVKRLGYAPRTLVFDLSEQEPDQNIQVVMKPIPAELADVIVLGQDSRLRQFYERKNLHSSGSFITQDDIKKLEPKFSSDLFRRVPGASIRSARFGNAIRLRGCRPKVWMDGVPMRDIELDELTTPGQIAGLEIYASTAGLPAEYMDVAPRPCGVILVWTRVD